MRDLTVSCLSAPLVWSTDESPHAATVDRVVHELRAVIDTVLPLAPGLIVLPEACDIPRGLSRPRLREYVTERGERVSELMASVARDNGCHVAWTSEVWPEGVGRNRMTLVDGSGTCVLSYDKVFPAPTDELDVGIRPGDGAQVLDLELGRVGALICFDLNFVELTEEYARLGPELLLFPSIFDGGLLQPYWAFRTRSYLAAAAAPPNRSRIISPVGRTLAESTEYTLSATATIDRDVVVVHLDDNDRALAAAQQALGPDLHLDDPGRLGVVLLTSRDPGRSPAQICERFGIERLDDYLARSRRLRAAALSAPPQDLH